MSFTFLCLLLFLILIFVFSATQLGADIKVKSDGNSCLNAFWWNQKHCLWFNFHDLLFGFLLLYYSKGSGSSIYNPYYNYYKNGSRNLYDNDDDYNNNFLDDGGCIILKAFSSSTMSVNSIGHFITFILWLIDIARLCRTVVQWYQWLQWLRLCPVLLWLIENK